MRGRRWSDLLEYLKQLRQSTTNSGADDAALLERYVHQQDEAAFELLLWRHGTLVFNVCRRILPCEQDAEEAFQATFLAFIRKAPSIVRGGSVASWLYKVAYRVSLEAKARAGRLAAREKVLSESVAVQTDEDPAWREMRPLLDEELNRLPERLRRPLILCYLEGKTNAEAARQLGCPMGTIFSRLARGREMLRLRLLRRGLTLTISALTAALMQHTAEAVPTPLLVRSTVRAALLFAGGQSVVGVSIHVPALAEGVLRTMFLTKLKIAALLLLVVGLFAAGGVVTQHALKAAPQPDAQKELSKPAREKPKEEPKKIAVQIIHPKPRILEGTTYCTGRFRAVAQQDIYPAVSGHLREVNVDLGDRVKRGDILAKIDSRLLEMDAEQAAASLELGKGKILEAKARVTTAKAELDAATSRSKEYASRLRSHVATAKFRESQHQRYKQLYEQRSIDARLLDEQEDQLEAAREQVNATKAAILTVDADVKIKQTKIESAKAQLIGEEASLRIAQAALEKARLQVEFTCVRAAFDGVVTQRSYSIGEYITAGNGGARHPLLTIVRTDTLRAIVNVAETDVPYVHPGLAVKLRNDNLPEGTLPRGTVSRTGFAIDEHNGCMRVEIDVPNAKGLLRPGMNVGALIYLDKKAPPRSLLVPYSCVRIQRGRAFVYVVREGKAHRTPVNVSTTGTGSKTGEELEINTGLQAADLLVLEPSGLDGEVIPVEIKKDP